MPTARSHIVTPLSELIERRSVTYIEQRSSDLLTLPTTYFGVEMELEAGDDRNAVHSASIALSGRRAGSLVRAVSDGSLRRGVEMVFATPLFGENAITAIDHMYAVKEQLNLAGSIRTSTHVHVNYSDICDTAATIQSSIATFLLIEGAMCATAGTHREHNTFCVPSYLTNPAHENGYYDIVAAVNEEQVVSRLVRIGDLENRYTALNISALFRHGTLEYRQLGTVNREQLMLWINLLLSIKKCGLENDTDTVINAAPTLDTFVSTMLGSQAMDCLVINSDARHRYVQARERMLGAVAPAAPATAEVYDPYVENNSDEDQDDPVDYTDYDQATPQLPAVLDTETLSQYNARIYSMFSGFSNPPSLSDTVSASSRQLDARRLARAANTITQVEDRINSLSTHERLEAYVSRSLGFNRPG